MLPPLGAESLTTGPRGNPPDVDYTDFIYANPYDDYNSHCKLIN